MRSTPRGRKGNVTVVQYLTVLERNRDTHAGGGPHGHNSKASRVRLRPRLTLASIVQAQPGSPSLAALPHLFILYLPCGPDQFRRARGR